MYYKYAGEADYPARFKSRGLKIAMRAVALLTTFLPIRRALAVVTNPENLLFYSSLLPATFQKSLAVRIVCSMIHFVVMGTRYSFTCYAFAVQLMVTLMASTMLKSTRFDEILM